MSLDVVAEDETPLRIDQMRANNAMRRICWSRFVTSDSWGNGLITIFLNSIMKRICSA